MRKADPENPSRQNSPDALRPLDENYRARVPEHLLKSERENFPRRAEAVCVHMIDFGELQMANGISTENNECWTCGALYDSESAKKSLGERRFPGTQFSGERDH